MELRQLRYFLSLAEELHFGRAARREHIGQPALSLQVARLEAELGVKLFERTSRRVHLTEAGKSILHHTRLAVRHAEAALQIARLAGKGQRGCLRLSYAQGADYGDAVELVASFQRLRPDIRLELRVDYENGILDGIRSGTTDVGVLWATPDPPEGVTVVGLFTEEVVVAVSRSHHLAGEGFVGGEELLRERLILPPRQQAPAIWALVFAQLATSALLPAEVREEPSWAAMVRAVSREGGVGLLPACAASYMAIDDVVYLPCYRPPLSLCLGLAWREQDTSPILQAFVNHCRSDAQTRRRTPPEPELALPVVVG